MSDQLTHDNVSTDSEMYHLLTEAEACALKCSLLTSAALSATTLAATGDQLVAWF